LPDDAMHDVLEGVLQYECKEMLKEFILKEKYLTLEQLNDRMTQFDYGYFNDKNLFVFIINCINFYCSKTNVVPWKISSLGYWQFNS
jgi:hypothetical protein